MNRTDTTAAEWVRCERISNLPAVHEVLDGLVNDPTGDNSTIVVREILHAVKYAELQRDAERFEWISGNYDEFRQLQEQNPDGGIELLHAVDERVEAKRLYAGNQALVNAGIV